MIKKTLTALLVVTVLIAVVGCGGGGGKKGRGYYYEWEALGLSSEKYSMVSPQQFSSSGVVNAGYVSSYIPPYTSISLYNNEPRTFTTIYTYYENDIELTSTPVESTFNIVTNGHFLDLDGNQYASMTSQHVTYAATKTGIQHITATWNGQVLNIPVRVYDYLALNLDQVFYIEGDVAYDFDANTWLSDINDPRVDIYIDKKYGGLYTPYGSFGVNDAISTILTVPVNGYTSTQYPPNYNHYGAVIVKTSEGKFVKTKIAVSGITSKAGSGCGMIVFTSNQDGTFEY